MLLSNTLVWTLSFSLSLAKPISLSQRKRFIDEDHNGIPDECKSTPNPDGTYECLENGAWTAVVSTTTATATPTLQPVSHAVATAQLPSGTLIAASDWKAQNGSAWSISYVGNLGFTDEMQAKNLGGDKCRTSQLGGKVIWNCGDMECNGDWETCGFSMGPAMYGTDSVMTVNTDGITNIASNNFLSAWSGDPAPVAPQTAWGMDTSNIAAINDTHGVTYAWEIWRGAPDNSIVNRGNAVASVTLGQTMPVATRMGPLLTDANSVQLGLLAIMRDANYIYIYSQGGPSNLLVTRVAASDDVFDATKYESLSYNSDTWTNGIPTTANQNSFGMTTANSGGKFGCSVYGSVFFNNYLNKYTIICNIDESFTNMYVSDTPYGPWSAEYGLLEGWYGYGSMAHPEFSPDGSHKEIYFSQGPNSAFNMFKVTFN